MVLNTPPNVGMFFSDGSILNVAISNSVGPDQRVGFASPGAGTWDVIDEHAVHVTFVEFLTDADGTLTGILAFEGYPVLNEDEQTWLDDGSKTKAAFLDASYNITRVIGGDGSLGSVTANRMGPGVFGLPKATPPAPGSATPTS